MCCFQRIRLESDKEHGSHFHMVISTIHLSRVETKRKYISLSGIGRVTKKEEVKESLCDLIFLVNFNYSIQRGLRI